MIDLSVYQIASDPQNIHHFIFHKKGNFIRLSENVENTYFFQFKHLPNMKPKKAAKQQKKEKKKKKYYKMCT